MSTSPAKRGPYAKSAEKRAAIAKAAYEVVMEMGHVQLTTAAVAARAGMLERTMLYHFPTRDHLLVAAIEYFEGFIDGDGQEGERPLAPPSEFRDLIDQLAQRSPGEDKRLRLQVALASAAQDPTHPAHEFFQRHYERVMAEMIDLMKARQAAGLAHPDRDPVRMARQFVAVWDGLQQSWLIRRDFDLTEEITEAFREISGQNALEARAAVQDLLSRI
ncbi:TetR/AcrR family transcriptional regulator [Tessaracoccus sp. MC1627]|uniref:TetR/AcrR family transcriptional regulator n=1 Tax=Tessaracoccus sp. MC1627 TaxID=2760312 RepID=UPI001603839C|nr:TetR/AcrR family transcriptional regulator [Tessaracoccus sp. MC1627]MBB1511634.1 TetR/AcrR family transcriptional regulator [Tessaracoccus sp. MC1627]